MIDKAHLPSSVGRTDLDRLDRVDRCVLLELADECREWLLSTEEYRKSLITPAARTLWSALIQGEFDRVAAIYDRLKTETTARDVNSLSEEEASRTTASPASPVAGPVE